MGSIREETGVWFGLADKILIDYRRRRYRENRDLYLYLEVLCRGMRMA